MITLTKLDQSPLLINYEAIKYAEAIPDTHIIFTNGDSVIVRESLEEVERRVIELRARVLDRARTLSSGAP